ncbi:MAG: diacylglycerol kinase [Gammaproteobacteria bacterium]|nr:diacylglycerol kinase [Gammaproteobacteria bacterium]
MADQNRGFLRFIEAAKYSSQGLKAAYRYEEAFRQEVWLGALLLPLAFYFADNGVELALLIGSLILVLIVELLNSAVEAVVDRIGSEQHELSGRAKDIGSAAVSFALLNVAIIWACVIFG